MDFRWEDIACEMMAQRHADAARLRLLQIVEQARCTQGQGWTLKMILQRLLIMALRPSLRALIPQFRGF